MSFAFFLVVSSTCPFLGALAFLCQGPLHIFSTPVGHVGLLTSSALSTTRSHGRFSLDSRVRNLFRESSTFSLVDAATFKSAKFSATDLLTFSSLSPLTQNTPPVKWLIHLQANSIASEVLPHPPRPQIVLVQHDVLGGLSEFWSETKFFSNQTRAFSRPVNSRSFSGAAQIAFIPSPFCPGWNFSFNVSTSLVTSFTSYSNLATLLSVVLSSNTTLRIQLFTSSRSSLITFKASCKSSRSLSDILKRSTAVCIVDIFALRSETSSTTLFRCSWILAISSPCNRACSFSLYVSFPDNSSALLILASSSVTLSWSSCSSVLSSTCCSLTSAISSPFKSTCSCTSDRSSLKFIMSATSDWRSKWRASTSDSLTVSSPWRNKSCRFLEDSWAALSARNTWSLRRPLRCPNMVLTSASLSSCFGEWAQRFLPSSRTERKTARLTGGLIKGHHSSRFKSPPMSVVLASVMSPLRVPRVGMKTLAISHAPVAEPHCCLSLLSQQIFGRGDLWRRFSSFFHMLQVAHLEEWRAQVHGGSDCRGGLDLINWYQATIFPWINCAIPCLVMFRAHPTITQFLCSFLSRSTVQLTAVILSPPLTRLKFQEIINDHWYLATRIDDIVRFDILRSLIGRGVEIGMRTLRYSGI